MALDTDKIDEAVLALLFLTRHQHWRAWKEFDWDALDRLYEKGLIGDRSTRPSPSCSPRRACAAPKNSSGLCSVSVTADPHSGRVKDDVFSVLMTRHGALLCE